MSQINTNAILDASGGTTTTVNGFTPTASNMAGRNLIINGDMRIAQRGTSLSSYSSGNDVKVLDRWKTAPVTAGTWTLSQESDAPDGFSNSLKFLCTTANSSLSVNSNLGINQLFEGLNLTSLAKGTSSAKSLTLSMWVKSNKTGTYVAELFDSNNSRSISATYTISSSDVWEYKTIHEAMDYTKENYYAVVNAFPDQQVVITEAGWATNSNGRGIEPSNVNEELQAIYFKQLIEWSRSNGVLTFVFEAFDENWKGSQEILEPEKHWGLYRTNRTPKLAMQLEW